MIKYFTVIFKRYMNRLFCKIMYSNYYIYKYFFRFSRVLFLIVLILLKLYKLIKCMLIGINYLTILTQHIPIKL